MIIPDNFDRWERHEQDREKRLAERPRCDICDQPIQDDHFYLINGDHVCTECLNDQFRQEIELDE